MRVGSLRERRRSAPSRESAARSPRDLVAGTAVASAAALLVSVVLERARVRPEPAAAVYEPLDGAAVAAVMPSHGHVPAQALVEEVLEHVGGLVLVDDGSDEEVARRLQAVAAAHEVDLIRLPRRHGKGTAVRAGIDHLLTKPTKPQAVLLIDADGQHPAAAVPGLLAAGACADLVIGDRFGDLDAMPLGRRVANVGTQRLFRLATGYAVRDTQSGLRLLRERALETFPTGGYEAETRHLKRVLLEGLTVTWMPMPAIYGGERSSFRTWQDGARVLWAVVRPAGPANPPSGRSRLPVPYRRAHRSRSACPGTPARARREPPARAAAV